MWVLKFGPIEVERENKEAGFHKSKKQEKKVTHKDSWTLKKENETRRR